MDFNDLLDDIETPFKLSSHDNFELRHYQKVNLPLLQAVRERLVAEPERHGQGGWGVLTGDSSNYSLDQPIPVDACGTAYCVAGWAGVLTRTAGWSGWTDGGRTVWAFLPLGSDGQFMDEGEWVRHGAAILGLPQMGERDEIGVVFDPEVWHTIRLFHGGNSRRRLLRCIDYLIEAGKLAQGITYVGRHYALAQS